MANTYDPEWLKRAMSAARVRTGQLAEASGVSRSQIQRIRNGMAPRMNTLAALQRGLATLDPKPAKRTRPAAPTEAVA